LCSSAVSLSANSRRDWRGAELSWLDRSQITARIPFLATPWQGFLATPWQGGDFDPLGGRLRIRRALVELSRRVTIRHGAVVSIDDDGSTTLADGEVVRGDRVLICAGVETPAPLRSTRHRDRPAHSIHPRVRLKERMHRRRVPFRARRLRAAARQHRPLGPRAAGGGPGDRARVVPDALARRPGGLCHPSGPAARRRRRPAGRSRAGGRIVAFVGSNLMKFGPLLGDLLA
jgi:sarcosine oxidase